VETVWRVAALCLLVGCARHRVVKFSLEQGEERCQGTLDHGTAGCEVRYVSTAGDGTTSISSFHGEMRCGQRTVVCAKPLHCECL
jgi:hypothetical protein